MTTREIALWCVVAMVASWTVVWLTWGAPALAAVAMVASIAFAAAETLGFRQLEKRDELRSPPPDVPKE